MIDVAKATAEDPGAYFLAATSEGILDAFFWCLYGLEAKNFFVGISVVAAHSIRRFAEILIYFCERHGPFRHHHRWFNSVASQHLTRA